MQILWINLIMDVLAAAALATEAPHPTELADLQKDSQNDDMIKPVMRRTIWFQAIYQTLVIVTLLYFGPMFYGFDYNLVKDHLVNTAEPTVKDQHFTMLFQTFCLMNIVNMLNCRVIGTPENKQMNVFVRIHHNWLFPIILLAELNF
jgi:magnesium-transporting ATPase (P-type)